MDLFILLNAHLHFTMRRQNNEKVDNEMVGHFKQKFRCSLLHLVLVCRLR